MSPNKFSKRKVRQTFLRLDTSKSTGPGGIPAIVLKTCAPQFAPILKKLFQLSCTLGKKEGPKKGDKSNPLNYCPIAITSLISKTIPLRLLAFTPLPMIPSKVLYFHSIQMTMLPPISNSTETFQPCFSPML